MFHWWTYCCFSTGSDFFIVVCFTYIWDFRTVCQGNSCEHYLKFLHDYYFAGCLYIVLHNKHMLLLMKLSNVDFDHMYGKWKYTCICCPYIQFTEAVSWYFHYLIHLASNMDKKVTGFTSDNYVIQIQMVVLIRTFQTFHTDSHDHSISWK